MERISRPYEFLSAALELCFLVFAAFLSQRHLWKNCDSYLFSFLLSFVTVLLRALSAKDLIGTATTSLRDSKVVKCLYFNHLPYSSMPKHSNANLHNCFFGSISLGELASSSIDCVCCVDPLWRFNYMNLGAEISKIAIGQTPSQTVLLVTSQNIFSFCFLNLYINFYHSKVF